MDPKVKREVTDDEIREFIHRVPMCKDCEWRRVDISGQQFSRCQHPLVVNPGSGEGSFCSIERRYKHTPCGPSGRLFEPRRRWSVRIDWWSFLIAASFILSLAILVWAGLRK